MTDQSDTSTTPPIQYARSAVPPGCAIVERVGQDDSGRMTALLVFPNGPPDLSFNVVWQAQPVRLTVEEHKPS